jgi:glycosyltransferase involved in cell wall biosynthesis
MEPRPHNGRVDTSSPSRARVTDAPQPLVSIVVPVWNGERYLRESLDSILGQTYPNIEVIAVDDASTDGTGDILASYGDRIRVLRQPETRGIYGNANDGIAIAEGEFVGVFHSDDVYQPEMVEREVAWLLRNPDSGAVFTSAVFIDAESREYGRKQLPVEVRGNRALDYATVLNTLLSRKNAFLGCPTALVRAHVYGELGVYRDAEFKNTSDLEMWLRIARSRPIGVLEDELIHYRRGHGSSAERYHRLRTDQERFFTIMDIELAAENGRAVATNDALRAYEAHRAVDTVMRAVNHYVLGERANARSVLGEVSLRTLAASDRIQRGRMVTLALALHVLVRLPRMSVIAGVFERRWHGRAPLDLRQS